MWVLGLKGLFSGNGHVPLNRLYCLGGLDLSLESFIGMSFESHHSVGRHSLNLAACSYTHTGILRLFKD